MKAVDVSNFTGVLPDSDLDLLKEWEVTHVIIGTQDAVIAKAQIESFLKHEFTIDLYTQFSANNPLVAQFRRTEDVAEFLELADKHMMPTNYIAAEQTSVDPWTGTIAAYRLLFEEALIVAVGLGLPETGIYTSKSQWSALLANTNDFAHYPLWFANYDHVAYLSAPSWRSQGFGGWWEPSLKQYEAGDDNLGFVMPSGKRVDFSVDATP